MQNTLDAADLLLKFLNTVDIEQGTDSLDTASALRSWLAEQGLLSRTARVSREDLTLALSLRAELRAALGDPAASRPSRSVLAALPLTVSLDADGQPGLQASGTGVRGALGAIAEAVATAQANGSWDRLKVCPAENCSWAFYDASKNRSRQWCTMGICGNRNKTRAYRARQRTA